MNDPIDRQEALKAIQDLYPTMPRINFGDNTSNWQQKYRQYIECENVIRILPTAERHGKWLHGQGFAGNYFDCLICNQCKKESMAKTNYCPHCGARMDGE